MKVERMEGEPEDTARIRLQHDQTTSEHIRQQVILHTNIYLEDNGYNAINDSNDQNFSDTGMDSLDLMMLAEKISSALEIDMELTALIDYPTVQALCGYIRSLMVSRGDDGWTLSLEVDKEIQEIQIGITKVGDKLPLSEITGTRFSNDCISKIPFTRWDVEWHLFNHPKELSTESCIRFGAFVEKIEYFDSQVWNISSVEAKHMDPQQRLLLELVGQISLGHDVSEAAVFVGASTCEYYDLLLKHREVSQHTSSISVISAGISILPGRVAFHLGMQGPAVATDTACSSSLVSLSIAADMTEFGTIILSYCCSSNLLLCSSGFRVFDSANMLAPDGRCKAIDESSDGFSRGEGITALELAAINESSCYDCILKGTYVNQDGRSSRLTAPNGPAQSALIAGALRRSKRLPSDVTQLMLHGTGTPLGDPIEIGAAFKVYSQGTMGHECLSLSAVKSSIGHTEAAAGIASLIGAIRTNTDRTIIPTLHMRHMNPNIYRLYRSFPDVSEKSQVYRTSAGSVQQNIIVEVAGVSSFASQGTNCHAIIGFGSSCHTFCPQLRCIWHKRSLWILAQPKSRIALLTITQMKAFSFKVPFGNYESPDAKMQIFLTASKDAMGVLHPDAQCISSIIGLENSVHDHSLKVLHFQIMVDWKTLSASLDQGSGWQEFASGKIEVFNEKPLLGQVQTGKRSIQSASVINLLLKLQKADIGSLKGGDHSFALAKWRALDQHNTSQLGCSLKSARAVLFGEVENTSILNDPQLSIIVSPSMRILGTSFIAGRPFPACWQDDQFLYEHDYILGALDFHRQEKFSEEFNFAICGNIFQIQENCSHDAAQLSLSLAILQECYDGCKASLIRSTIQVAPEGSSPLAKAEHAFHTSFESIGSTMNREMGHRIAFVSEQCTRNGIIVEQALQKVKSHKALTSYSLMDLCQSYLISGGTSGIGLLLCDCLRDEFGPVICYSRSGTVDAKSQCFRLSSSAISLTFQMASVSSMEDMADVTRSTMSNINFINAAGVLKDSPIHKQTIKNVLETCSPKVMGLKHFLEIMKLERSLKSVVAFSSIAALMHPAGSSTYAAVNSVMEEIVTCSQSQGMETLSIQWGAWSAIGMVSASKGVKKAMSRLKTSLIDPARGMKIFVQITQISGPRNSLYTCIPFESNCDYFLANTVNSQSKIRVETPGKLMHNDVRWSEETIREVIQSVLSSLLEVQIDNFSESLIHYGADSLCAAEIQAALSEEFHVILPSTFLFDYPNIAAMADAILSQIGSVETKLYSSKRRSENDLVDDQRRPLCIDAIILRKPEGLSEDPLKTLDCTKIVGHDRWESNIYDLNYIRIRFAKFLVDVKHFDAELFKISAREGVLMDPQQRLLLEDSFAILSNLCFETSRNVGVLIGISFWDYSMVSQKHLFDKGMAHKLTGRNLSVSSGRVSYLHGYNGPSMTIDTACSSSLVCTHVATRLMEEGNLSSVRVGSAMISLSPEVVKCLAAASMTSEHGRSRTLDQQANGYGRGEATAFLSISRSANGQAIIESTAVNQDGRSAALTAPNGPSQIVLLDQLYNKSLIAPFDTCLHELHGTGTQLGDPIEINAIAKFHHLCMGKDIDRLPLNLAATKTIFGHSEPVAGCVGIYAIITQLTQLCCDPLLHLNQVSPHVTQALAKVSTQVTPHRCRAPLIQKNEQYISSISGFAFQGTNSSTLFRSNRHEGITVVGKSLQKLEFYKGVMRWFVGKTHPWIVPAISPELDQLWAVNHRTIEMSKMMEHRIFGNPLLPGMAIFRMMSDTIEMSCSYPGGSLVQLLAKSSISIPISLRQNIDLYLRFSADGSTVSTVGKSFFREEQFATGHCVRGSHVRYKDKLIKNRPPPYQINLLSSLKLVVSIGNLCVDDINHAANFPSIESMDASTHLAAYGECSTGVNVSIPVACDLQYMESGIMKSDIKDRVAICADDTSNECKRDYVISHDISHTMRLICLRSKQVHNQRNNQSVVSHIKHQYLINSYTRQTSPVSELPTVTIPRVNKNGFITSWSDELDKWVLSLSLLVQEYIRAHIRYRTTNFFLPDKKGKQLILGQMSVASNELRLQNQVTEYNQYGMGFSTHCQTSLAVSYSQRSQKSTEMNNFRCPHEPSPTIVIGGTKGIGLLFSEWAAQTIRTPSLPIHILGRAGFASGPICREAQAVSISSYNCSLLSDNNALVERLLTTNISKCTVFYSAGVTNDRYYMTSDLKSYRTTFAPKYVGLKALTVVLTPKTPLLSLISTSTMSIDIGNVGQGNYIAANSAMEIQSQNLLDFGMPSRSIRYGPWRGLGLLLMRENAMKALARMGLIAMTPFQGLQATIDFLTSKETASSIGILNTQNLPSKLSDHFQDRHGLPERFENKIQSPVKALRESDIVINDQSILYHTIHNILKDVLGLDHVSDDEPFFEIGADSISIIEIRNSLSQTLNKPLSPTILFDYPTMRKLFGALTADHTERPKRDIRSTKKSRRVFISSIAQVVPNSRSDTFESLCSVLQEEKNLQESTPPDRWDNDAFFSPSRDGAKINTRFATFIRNIWRFDSRFFGLTPSDARGMDPQCRILLSTTASAMYTQLDTCGHDNAGTIGVFVGCMFFDYSTMFAYSDRGLDSSIILGNGAPYICGRLAYTFDLTGPSMGIDTACSSSLVATHCGRTEILGSNTDVSVCCGANAILSPHTSAIICQLGALSNTGRSLSLDSMADGYGRGEAFVSCVLSYDNPFKAVALLSATLVNQDGRSASMTAPNGPSQEALINSCISQACIFLEDVFTISIHGTGTPLGDPLEAQALSNIFAHRNFPVCIVSNKALLGHCEGAAGSTGLLNSLYNLEHKAVNGLHTLRALNTHLHGILERQTLNVPRSYMPHSEISYTHHVSGTSSFGMSGTNAHAIASSAEGIRSERWSDQFKWMRNQTFNNPTIAERYKFCGRSKVGQCEFQVSFTATQIGKFLDHKIFGVHILPAATQLEIIGNIVPRLSPIQNEVFINGCIFIKPLDLSLARKVRLELFEGSGRMDISDNPSHSPCATLWVGTEGVVLAKNQSKYKSAQSRHAMTLCHTDCKHSGCTAEINNLESIEKSAGLDAGLHLAAVLHINCGVPVAGNALTISGHYPRNIAKYKAFCASSKEGVSRHSMKSPGEGSIHLLRASEITSKKMLVHKEIDSQVIWTVLPQILVDLVPSNAPNAFFTSSPSDDQRGLSIQRIRNKSLQAFQTILNGGSKILNERLREIGKSSYDLSIIKTLLRVYRAESHEKMSCKSDFLQDSFKTVKVQLDSEIGTYGINSNTSCPNNATMTSLGGISSLTIIYLSNKYAGLYVQACSRNPRKLRYNFSQYNIRLSKVDLCYREDADAALLACTSTHVFHTAGVVRDALMKRVEFQDILATLAPKLHMIDNLYQGLDRSCISVYSFSSIAHHFGSAGQSSYAMSNAILDMHTMIAHSKGLLCYCIQWGLWTNIGMASKLDHQNTRRLHSLGFCGLSTSEGLTALETSISLLQSLYISEIMVSKIDIPLLYHHLKSKSYLSHISDELFDMRISSKSPGSHKQIQDKIAFRPQDMIQAAPLHQDTIRDTLIKMILRQLGEVAPMNTSLPILQMGFDSVSSVELTQSIEHELNISLPFTFVYDCPMLEDMVQFIVRNRVETPSMQVDNLLEESLVSERRQISIVSTAARYPSDSITKVLSFSKDTVRIVSREFSHSENSLNGYFETFASNFRHDQIYAFDANLFGIPQSIASKIDPNIRWLLMLHQELFFCSKIKTRSETGVFLGWMWSHEYINRVWDSHVDTAGLSSLVTGNSSAFAVGYIAYLFNLCGPCAPVDTACSSTLVSLHLSIHAITSGDCQHATVSGLNSFMSASTWAQIFSINASSLDGRCKTLDSEADGYGRGEAFASILLEYDAPLNEAFVAVLGSSVKNIAYRSSLTSPHGPSQSKVIKDAIEKSGGRIIRQVALHGTGTSLGDPIELQSLIQTLEKLQGINDSVDLISPKSSVGHTEGTAGLTNVLACIDCNENMTSLVTHHLRHLNPLITWSLTGNLVIHRQNAPLQTQSLNCSGSSSFGMSGVNSHAVMQHESMFCSSQLTSPERNIAHYCLDYESVAETIVSHVRPYIWILSPNIQVPWIKDHVVNKEQIVPGTFFLKMALLCTKSYLMRNTFVLSNTAWIKSCFMRDITLIEARMENDGQVTFGSNYSHNAYCYTTARNHINTISELHKRSMEVYPRNVSFAPINNNIPVTQGDLCRVNQGKDKNFGTISHLDAILHMNAIFEKALYVPTALESYVQMSEFPSIEKVVSAFPKFDVKRTLISVLRGVADGNTELAFLHFQGSLISSKDPNLDETMIYVLEDQGKQPLGQKSLCPISKQLHTGGGAFYVDDVAFNMQTNDYIKSFCTQIQGLQALYGRQMVFQGRIFTSAYPLHDQNAAGDPVILQMLAESYQVETLGTKQCIMISPYQRRQIKYVEQDKLTVEASVIFENSLKLQHETRDRFPDRLLSVQINQPDNLEHQLIDTAVKEDKVGICVNSVGLNFRDLLVAMGMYPSSIDRKDIGSDFSGYVIHSPLAHFQIGDRIFGQSKGVMRENIMVNPELICHIPPNLSMAEASGIPTVFLTALQCIRCLSKQSQSLLIHSASGGLGLALTQLARREGLTVMTTAGSQRKRAFMRYQGFHAHQGRSTKFIESIMIHSDTQPDAVINTMTSPGMISASAALLCNGGCFVEVSKRDIFCLSRILQDRPDVRYQILAIDMMPKLCIQMGLRDLNILLAGGAIRPTSGVTFSLADIQNAALSFKSSHNIGKVISTRRDGRHTSRQTWIVTGGLGALGKLTSSLFLSRGCDIILPARKMPRSSGFPPDSASKVEIVLGDINDRDIISSVFESRMCSSRTVGLVHSSGSLRDSTIPNITVRGSKEVFATKSTALVYILSNLASKRLSIVISYSSISAVWANIGQANYSCANKILDALSRESNQQGRCHQVVNWGPWNGPGMAQNLDRRGLSSRGISFLAPKLASQILMKFFDDRFLQWKSSQHVCIQMKRNSTMQILGFDGHHKVDGQIRSLENTSELKSKPISLSDFFQIKSEIRNIIDSLLTELPEDSAPLMASGLDSLGMVELVNCLKETFKQNISAAFPFNYPTIDAMAAKIHMMIGNEGSSPPKQIEHIQPRSIHIKTQDINLLDFSAMMPSVYEDTDCARTVPLDRWDIERSQGLTRGPNALSMRFGNFVKDLYAFDNEIFRVTQMEAEILDPQQRCLMSTLADIKKEYLSNTAISIGIGKLEDPWHILKSTDHLIKEGNGMVSTSRSAAAAAGRLSFTFGYTGPCLSIDTACSSSLVALKSLYDTMISQYKFHGFAGGVSLPMSLRTSLMLATSSMLARDGRCKTMDSMADGYGRAESCCMIKLATSDSLNHTGETMIQAKLVANACNQDGSSSSLTAPFGPSQESLIRELLGQTRLSASTINAFGMHGTGTALGDPIEVNALFRVFKTPAVPLRLVSSKATYGHAETASGLLGLIFNLSVLSQKHVYQFSNLRTLNMHAQAPIQQAAGLAQIPRQAQPLVTRDQRMFATVSAFAFQGSNASSVIEKNGENHIQLCQSLWAYKKVFMPHPVGHELLERVIFHAASSIIFSCTTMNLKLQLLDHRVRNNPVMPAAGCLDVMQGLATVLRRESAGVFQEIAFIRPFLLHNQHFHVSWHTLRGQIKVYSDQKFADQPTDFSTAFFRKRNQVNIFERGRNQKQTSIMSWNQIINAQAIGVINRRIGRSSTHLTHILDSMWHLLGTNSSRNDSLYLPASLHTFNSDINLDTDTVVSMFAALTSIRANHKKKINCSSTTNRSQNTSISVCDLVIAPIMSQSRTGENHLRMSNLYLMENQISQVNDTIKPLVTLYTSSSQNLIAPAIIQLLKLWPNGEIFYTRVQPSRADRGNIISTMRACIRATEKIKEGPKISPFPDQICPNAIPLTEQRVPLNFLQTGTIYLSGGSGAIGSLIRSFLCEYKVRIIVLSRHHRLLKVNSTQGEHKYSSLSLHMGDGTTSAARHLDNTDAHRYIWFNLSGVLQDQHLYKIDLISLRSVISPKQAGTESIARSLRLCNVARILHFGSIASVLGNHSQASYIMANTILTTTSQKLMNSGHLSTVIHWGPWSLVEGMANSSIQKHLETKGIPILPPQQGLKILQSIMHLPFSPEYLAFEITYKSKINRNESSGTTIQNSDTIEKNPLSIDMVKSKISATVTSLLGADFGGESVKLIEHGLDSISAVTLAEALQTSLGISLSSTILFDYPTIQALTDYVINQTLPTPETAQIDPRDGIHHDIQVQICSTMTRFPGSRNRDIAQTWRDGGEIQTLTPACRWDVEKYYSPIQAPLKSYVRFAGWLNNIEMFEGHIFGLLPEECVNIDPQTRILLELTGEIRQSTSLDSSTSSFLGVMYNEYLDAILYPTGKADYQASSITGNGMSFLAGRISYHHGIQGKAVACDTACSSSLVALHMGFLSIKEGDYMSLIHGINIMLTSRTTARICLLKALSASGRCKTGDASADGYGRSESGCTICLRRLSEGDIMNNTAVLGSAIAQNGQSGGLTAPHGPSQASLLASVHQQSRQHCPNTISSLHGTGTALGDPIEFSSLQQSYNRKSNRNNQEQYIRTAVMATKSCTGHMEGTAGLCGLVLPLQSSRGRFVSPVVNLRTINNYISSLNFENIYVSREFSPMVQTNPQPQLSCGTSSFGMSGTNAHVICTDQDQLDERTYHMSWIRKKYWPLVPAGIIPLQFVALHNTRSTVLVQITAQRATWLQDHQLNHKPFLAGAATVAIFSHVARSLLSHESQILEKILFLKPVLLDGDPLTVLISGLGLSMHRNGNRVSQTILTTVVLGQQLSPQINISSKTDGQNLVSVPKVNLVSSFARVARSGLEDQDSKQVGNPCSLDASMHLALVSRQIDDRMKIPVSIQGFIDQPKSCHSRHASCVGAITACDVMASESHQTLQGILTKKIISIDDETRAEFDVRPGLFQSDAGRISLLPAPIRDPAKPPTYTICSKTETIFASNSWYGSLTVGSNIPAIPSQKKSIILSWQDHQLDMENLMTSSIFKAISKEITRLKISVAKHKGRENNCVINERYQRIESQSIYNNARITHSTASDSLALVTGAFGGIGSLASTWLSYETFSIVRAGKQVHKNVKILTREIEEVHLQCDISFAADLDGMFRSTRQLQHLHHSSGTLKDRLIQHVTPQDVRNTAASKSTTFRQVLEAMVFQGAEKIVIYSSISSIFGNRGQLPYIYANTTLNSLALHGRSSGMSVASIAWGPWNALGMTSMMNQEGLEGLGIRFLPAKVGLELLDEGMKCLSRNTTPSTIIAGWFDHINTLLLHMVDEKTNNDPELIASVPRPSTFSGEGGRDILLFVEDALQEAFESWEDDKEMYLRNMDSLQSVSVTEKLSSLLGLQLLPTVLYDYPSLSDLRDHLVSLVESSTCIIDTSENLVLGNKDGGSRRPMKQSVAINTRSESLMLGENYYSYPSEKELNQMSDSDLSNIENFIIGKHGVGEIRFLCPVDLRGIDLGSSVVITKRSMSLHGERNENPGDGMNQPALLVFRGASRKAFASPLKRRRLRSRLMQACQRTGGVLVHLDETRCEFIIKLDDWLIN